LREQHPGQQFARDAEVWKAFLLSQTFCQQDITYKEKQTIMKRIFTLLHGVFEDEYRTHVLHLGQENTTDMPEYEADLNLASVLSHGGRLVFQVPEQSWDLFIITLFGD